MMWFFERGNERLEIKTRYDNETSEYVLEVVEPGEARPVERFLDAKSFRIRLLEVERELDHMQWRANGSPRILADGWPDRTPPR
jgi:hypothetical protein